MNKLIALLGLVALVVYVSADCADHIYSCRDLNNNEVGTICGPSCLALSKLKCDVCDKQNYTQKCVDHGLRVSHFAVRTDKECKAL